MKGEKLYLLEPGRNTVGVGVGGIIIIIIIRAALPGEDVLFLVEEHVVAKSYNSSILCFLTTKIVGSPSKRLFN